MYIQHACIDPFVIGYTRAFQTAGALALVLAVLELVAVLGGLRILRQV